MKLVFIGNYFNHHQKALSDNFYDLLCGNYHFIITSKMSEERKALGYTNINAKYLLEYESNREKCNEVINSADAIIYGGAEAKYIKLFNIKNKLCFACSERLLKRSDSLIEFLPRAIKWNYYWSSCKNKYLLCSSAYAAKDYNAMGLFKGKTFKWGYYPQNIHYDCIEELIEQKENASLLWVGRFIDWKHPEIPIKIAIELKKIGIKFSLNMIGTGALVEQINSMILDNNLENEVHLLGSMSTENVRSYMEKSEIFLFTSDRNEGWGAVLNEAMNSGCAVVANSSIGAVPYLINDSINGYTYNNFDDLINNVICLLKDRDTRLSISKQAYYTIDKTWNANIAANNFLELLNSIINGNACVDIKDGPCSRD